jgi:glycine betaine/proline transport system ATP-binding protein
MDAGRDRSEVQAETGQILGVHDCTLDLSEGEVLVLMGLSGSGKSTLLRAINGLIPVTRGTVSIRDEDDLVPVTDASPARLRRLRQERVAMVFQQFALLPWRSVRENVALPLELAGIPRRAIRDRVDAQLDRVGLADRADSPVAELSGGMQQRVGLARALVTEAPILLMDEPFSALDPLIRARLQDELLALQRDLRRSIVFVSHDLDEAFKIGNRIAIMKGGRIVQCGTPQEIVAAPADDYVAAFIAEMNPLGVLRAGDVMGPPDGAEGPSLPHDAPIRSVLPRLVDATAPVPVTRDGRRVGALSRADLLRGLMRRG